MVSKDRRRGRIHGSGDKKIKRIRYCTILCCRTTTESASTHRGGQMNIELDPFSKVGGVIETLGLASRTDLVGLERGSSSYVFGWLYTSVGHSRFEN